MSSSPAVLSARLLILLSMAGAKIDVGQARLAVRSGLNVSVRIRAGQRSTRRMRYARGGNVVVRGGRRVKSLLVLRLEGILLVDGGHAGIRLVVGAMGERNVA